MAGMGLGLGLPALLRGILNTSSKIARGVLATLARRCQCRLNRLWFYTTRSNLSRIAATGMPRPLLRRSLQDLRLHLCRRRDIEYFTSQPLRHRALRMPTLRRHLRRPILPILRHSTRRLWTGTIKLMVIIGHRKLTLLYLGRKLRYIHTPLRRRKSILRPMRLCQRKGR